MGDMLVEVGKLKSLMQLVAQVMVMAGKPCFGMLKEDNEKDQGNCFRLHILYANYCNLIQYIGAQFIMVRLDNYLGHDLILVITFNA